MEAIVLDEGGRSVKRQEIFNYFQNHKDSAERIQYLKNAYIDTTVEIDKDGVRIGYHKQDDGLLMWEGSYHEITDTAQKVLPASEVVGFLRYLDSGEKVDFTNADAYIAAYKEDLYDYGPNGVRAVTLTKDLGVRYEIEKLRVGEFGEELPDKETWIKNHSNSAQNYCMEHQQQPDPENDGPDL